MSSGKLASQTAHAAVALYIKANQPAHLPLFKNINMWLVTGQKKVILKGVDDAHLLKLEKEALETGLLVVVVRDAGRTHLAPGSLTCLGLFGSESSINLVTGALNLYN